MKNGQQLSLFDIQLSPPSENEITQIMQAAEKQREPPKENRELCPYRIPTVEEIIKDFQSAATAYSTGKIFEDTIACGAIAISNAVDFTKCDEREERYKQIMSGYRAEGQRKLPELFAKVFALLSSVVYDNGAFNDYLGEIFMRLNIASDKAGQVFTPFNVSRMMARMIIGDGTAEKTKQEDEILTICDPCCGSGAMSLAALETLQSRGVNYARNVFIECSDIDIRCVYMAYLQLSLAGVPAIIKHQNTLTNEVWDVWKTPAFVMQYTRFYKYDN